MDDIEASTFPANSRLLSVAFGPAHLNVTLEPGGERQVAYTDVRALYGARIRRQHTQTVVARQGGDMLKNVGKFAVMAATGIPLPMGNKNKEPRVSSTTKDEFQYALGIRIQDATDLWYLINTSFNFRHALGAEAGYAAEINLRAFVRKLCEACPESRHDDFFVSIRDGRPMPGPLDSLLEFFRHAA